MTGEERTHNHVHKCSRSPLSVLKSTIFHKFSHTPPARVEALIGHKAGKVMQNANLVVSVGTARVFRYQHVIMQNTHAHSSERFHILVLYRLFGASCGAYPYVLFCVIFASRAGTTLHKSNVAHHLSELKLLIAAKKQHNVTLCDLTLW